MTSHDHPVRSCAIMWGHVITMRSCDITINHSNFLGVDFCFNPLGACLVRQRLTRRNWTNTVPYISSSLMSLMQSAGSAALSVGALGYMTLLWTSCWPRYTQGGEQNDCNQALFLHFLLSSSSSYFSSYPPLPPPQISLLLLHLLLSFPRLME